MSEERILLELRGVEKSRMTRNVLKDVSFCIRSGRIVGLIGDNGLGKTTLLQLMAGILKPDRGELVCGCKGISYLLSMDQLYLWMRVKDVLWYYRNFYEDFDEDRAGELLDLAGISQKQNLWKLSKGQAERVLLILCISRRTELYLMDEPLGGMDPYLKKDFKEFLLKNLPENSTVLMATHLLKDLETLMDEVIFVTGQGVRQRETEEIRENWGISVEQYYLQEVAYESDVEKP